MLVKINQLTYESKFDRKYACSLNNHCSGLRKLKTANRRLLRRKLNRGMFDYKEWYKNHSFLVHINVIFFVHAKINII